MRIKSDLYSDLLAELNQGGEQSANQLAVRLGTTRTRVNQILYRNPDVFIKTEGSPPVWRTSQSNAALIDEVKDFEGAKLSRSRQFYRPVSYGHLAQSEVNNGRSEFADLETWAARVQFACLTHQKASDHYRDLSPLFLDTFTETWARLHLRKKTVDKLLTFVSSDADISIQEVGVILCTSGNKRLWSDILEQVRFHCRNNTHVSVHAILSVIETTPWTETPDGRVLFHREDRRAKLLCHELDLLMARLDGLRTPQIAYIFSQSNESVRVHLKNLKSRNQVLFRDLDRRLEAKRRVRTDESLDEVQAEAQDLKANVLTFLVSEPGMSRHRLEELSGLTWGKLRQNLPSSWRKFIVVDEPPASTGWTKEQVIEALRSASAYEYPLSKTTFDELISVGEINCCLSQRVGQIFGKWSTACEAAGVESLPGWREIYDRNWSDEDCVAALCEFLLSEETSRSIDCYNRWQEKQQLLLPSSGTIRNYVGYGSWHSSIQMAFNALSGPMYSKRLESYLSGSMR